MGLQPAGGSIGAAGGAACGDLVSIRLRVEGGRVAAAGFDASGCGAAHRRRLRRRRARRGRRAARRRARRHARDRRRAGRALARQAARRRAGGRRAAPRARPRRARRRGAGAGDPRPHAGRDERRGRLRRRRAAVRARGRRRGRGHARAVGRRGERRRGVVLLGARRARARARSRTGWACRTSRSTCARSSAPASSTPWLDDHAAGLTPNPCVRCNGHVRLDAMLDFASRLGAAEPRHRPLRAPQRRRPAALGRRPGQGPGLHAVRARARDDRAPALPARRADQAGGARARRRGRACRSPPRPTRRTSASSPAPAARRSSRATAARASAPGEIVDRGGRVLGRHRGHHGFTVGQRKGIGIAAPEPLYVLATDARANR